MTRQDHWNSVGEGVEERVWELCDLYIYFSKCIINYNIRLNITIKSAMSQCIHAALTMD